MILPAPVLAAFLDSSFAMVVAALLAGTLVLAVPVAGAFAATPTVTVTETTTAPPPPPVTETTTATTTETTTAAAGSMIVTYAEDDPMVASSTAMVFGVGVLIVLAVAGFVARHSSPPTFGAHQAGR